MVRSGVGRLAALAVITVLLPAAPAAATQMVLLSVAPGFRASDLPAGVQPVVELRGVHVIEARTTELGRLRLTRAAGVRGMSGDVPMATTGASTGTGDSVLAPAAVGGIAGSSSAGKGVIVAVLDTGVADTRALGRSSGRLVSGPDFSTDAKGAPRDGFGHGTFMANLVAGGSADGAVVGIAPAAVVVDVKVADASGTTSLARVLKGLDWVATTGADRGVRVLSLSLAATVPSQGYGADPLTDAAEAVQRAGVTVVVAAGNDPSTIGDPAQDPRLFAIGAADSATSTVAAFSGRALVGGVARPDLVAPGVRMLSYLPPESALATAHPEAQIGRLWRGTGTSQATAVTAGSVAAFLSGRGALSPDDVRASFVAVALPMSGSAGSGAGLLVLPTKVRSAATAAGTADQGGSGASPSSTSWSSTSWSSTSWSSTSWSSTSWSSTSWSSTSWSSTSWSSWSGD